MASPEQDEAVNYYIEHLADALFILFLDSVSLLWMVWIVEMESLSVTAKAVLCYPSVKHLIGSCIRRGLYLATEVPTRRLDVVMRSHDRMHKHLDNKEKRWAKEERQSVLNEARRAYGML